MTFPYATTSGLLFSFLLFSGEVFIGVRSLTISSAQELINFSNDVNRGTSYSGSTVYLGSDIEFGSSLSQQFEPIGKNSSYYFNGTFEGQGHIINNLTMRGSSGYVGSGIFTTVHQYFGLFGYSKGSVIRNFVIDSSCSFYGSNYDTGSVVGLCTSCSIGRVVNIGRVSVGSEFLSIGGIVGIASSSARIINCVNYGSVKYPGSTTTYNNAYSSIGGIVGSSTVVFIQNCANYGTITCNKTLTLARAVSSYMYIGGIVGSVSRGNSIVTNCVSAGKVVVTSKEYGTYTGSIVGYLDPGSAAIRPMRETLIGSDEGKINITNCVWTGDVTSNKNYESKQGNEAIKQLNVTTMYKLNEYAGKNIGWDKWFTLHLNGGSINNISQSALVTTQKHFPEPLNEGNTVMFLYKNSGYEKVELETMNTTTDTELYVGWSTSRIRFIFENGTDPEVRIFNFNETVVYPADPEREGCTFIGWSQNIERAPPYDLDIKAQWDGNLTENISSSFSSSPESESSEKYSGNKNSKYIEIVFERKDLKKEDIEEIIKRYVDEGEKFLIVEVENEEVRGTRVIIKFTDTEKARTFMNKITQSNELNDNRIVRVNFVNGFYRGLSSVLCPFLSSLAMLVLF